jgi:hypothetical protein
VWQVLDKTKIHAELCWETLKERDNFGKTGLDERIILKYIFKE